MRLSQDPPPAAAHCFKEGMKLEAVDPAAPISIRPATVTKVTHFPIKVTPQSSRDSVQLVLLPRFCVLVSAQSTSIVSEMLLHFLFIHTFHCNPPLWNGHPRLLSALGAQRALFPRHYG